MRTEIFHSPRVLAAFIALVLVTIINFLVNDWDLSKTLSSPLATTMAFTTIILMVMISVEVKNS